MELAVVARTQPAQPPTTAVAPRAAAAAMANGRPSRTSARTSRTRTFPGSAALRLRSRAPAGPTLVSRNMWHRWLTCAPVSSVLSELAETLMGRGGLMEAGARQLSGFDRLAEGRGLATACTCPEQPDGDD